MAIEFNVAAEHKFFLGEDKVMDLTITEQDDVTPLDVSGLPLEWNLKKTDRALDPGIITKGIGSGLSVIGVFNINPNVNGQVVRIVFVSDDTDPDVTSVSGSPDPYTLKPNIAYRHSLKRLDVTNESILTFGSFLFLQATER